MLIGHLQIQVKLSVRIKAHHNHNKRVGSVRLLFHHLSIDSQSSFHRSSVALWKANENVSLVDTLHQKHPRPVSLNCQVGFRILLDHLHWLVEINRKSHAGDLEERISLIKSLSVLGQPGHRERSYCTASVSPIALHLQRIYRRTAWPNQLKATPVLWRK